MVTEQQAGLQQQLERRLASLLREFGIGTVVQSQWLRSAL